jgi:hypothetical protein
VTSRTPVIAADLVSRGRVDRLAKAPRAGHLPKGMNKTEAAYAERLEMLRRSGEILSYDFEAITLKLAPNTRYTPDFLVITSDATVELHEVKGHWYDDARVKIKVAARLFPFRFVAVRKKSHRDGGGWDQEEFVG